MKTKKQQTIFLSLVPHRDTRLVMQKYSAELFKAGFPGAFDFPWAAPLAIISNPFPVKKLKDLAGKIRQNTGTGKLTAAKAASIVFPYKKDSTVLFGPCLDIPIMMNSNYIENSTDFFPKTLIGCCLLNVHEVKKLSQFTEDLLPPPKLSFRAAAIANIFWQPASSFGNDNVTGSKWEIGELAWLPKEEA